MTQISKVDDSTKHNEHSVRVHLPGFISEVEIGLGDVIKRATSYVGIKACGGCEKRAATLNRWVSFTNGQQK